MTHMQKSQWKRDGTRTNSNHSESIFTTHTNSGLMCEWFPVLMQTSFGTKECGRYWSRVTKDCTAPNVALHMALSHASGFAKLLIASSWPSNAASTQKIEQFFNQSMDGRLKKPRIRRRRSSAHAYRLYTDVCDDSCSFNFYVHTVMDIIWIYIMISESMIE